MAQLNCYYAPHHLRRKADRAGFPARKEKIAAALQNTVDHGDLECMGAIRKSERTLYKYKTGKNITRSLYGWCDK